MTTTTPVSKTEIHEGQRYESWEENIKSFRGVVEKLSPGIREDFSSRIDFMEQEFARTAAAAGHLLTSEDVDSWCDRIGRLVPLPLDEAMDCETPASFMELVLCVQALQAEVLDLKGHMAILSEPRWDVVEHG
jgi:hypothetical protein